MKKPRELKDGAATLATRIFKMSLSSLTALLALAFAVPAVAGGPRSSPDAIWVLSQEWSRTGIDQALARLNGASADLELSATTGDDYACGVGRVITVLREVHDGDCIDCMRLVFDKSSDQYVLENIILQYSTTDKSLVTSYAKALLSAAGLNPVEIAKIRSFVPLDRWSSTWVSGSEYRSVELTIEVKKKWWSLHFSQLRQPITSPTNH